MTRSIHHPWLNVFAWLTAAATLLLIGLGGLVTSHEAGPAVPDWPTSYGYNMFLFPNISQ
jgi:cytochrome c oxidase assembly protein subunit 15